MQPTVTLSGIPSEIVLQPTARLAGRHAVASPFSQLAAHKYCQLVTFRRDGSEVRTPVWFAADGDRLFVKTEDPSGKIRRIRRDPRARVAPCTLFGRELGAWIDGRARLLTAAEEAHAEDVLRTRYGFGRKLFGVFVEPLIARRKTLVFLEVVPEAADASSGVL